MRTALKVPTMDQGLLGENEKNVRIDIKRK